MTRAVAGLLAFLVATTASAAPSPDEQRICEIINERRAEADVAPLRASSELYAAAKSHSDDMAATGRLEHNSSDGTLWSKRVGRFYPGWVALGENIAAGVSDPAAIVGGFMSSDTHRRNVLGSSFTDVGCALTLGDTAFGKLAFVTTDFGSRGLLPIATPTPQPGPTATPAAVAIERFSLRGRALNALVLLPPGSPLAAPVALEVDGAVVAASGCVARQGRGARSTCPGTDVRITPAGVPRYRIRLRLPAAVAAASSVRLSAAGQVWDIAP